MDINIRIKQMRELRNDAEAAYARGDFDTSWRIAESAEFIEDELRDLAYINACESDSPNSPDFDNVLNAELFKLGIEE